MSGDDPWNEHLGAYGAGGPGADAAARGESAPGGVLSVSQLTRRIGALVEGLGRVAVEGEVSRITRAASGHVYFDLKDLDARLSCALWRSQVARALRFDLEEGQQVIVRGKLDVYAPRGTYSLKVERIELAGLGALLAQLEALKVELRDKGWFERRRPLPRTPACVGVVTSRDGAAFQDFLRTRSLRWPGYPVRLAHTPVQGPGAAARIAQAIDRLAASGVDVLVVCRGGGSLEDLWAFNERPVAEAIWRCPVPVVCGVGHEVDVTLADHVADHRAHTPTDAAQLVLPDRGALVADLARAAGHLARAIDGLAEERAEALARAVQSLRRHGPRRALAERAEFVARVADRMARALGARALRADAHLAEARRRLEHRHPRARLDARERDLTAARHALTERATALLSGRERALAELGGKLAALSPLSILGRGYAIASRADGSAVRDAGALARGEALDLRFHRGTARARVESCRSEGESPGSEKER